ncbi:MAG: SH3 domain-containing protein [Litorilinea sp.]
MEQKIETAANSAGVFARGVRRGARSRLRTRAGTRWIILPILAAAMMLLAGCGIIFGTQEDAPVADEAVDPERELIPTFTPTPEGSQPVVENPPPAAQDTQAPLATATPLPAEDVAPEETVPDEPEPEPPVVPEPPAPEPEPSLFINIPAANLRLGPGTNYGLAGAATQDQQFEVIGRSPDGTWWQICCINGQQAWIFGDLARTENVTDVPVAQNIPAPPPVVQAPPPQPEPEPQPQPEPEQPAEPAPAPPPANQAVHAGPCSQCKFRISGGPSKQPNGGLELKIQADFIHSGVDGGQRQGDYRIGLEKDGQLIGYFSNVLSIRLTNSQGPMGPYNYEASVGSSDLPGGTIAGRYFFWVIDGNRVRDSEVWTLDLAGDEGMVWVQFDQN